MSFLDWFTSTRKPAPGTPALDPAVVREKILALNRPTAPFQVVDGSKDSADLVAEWKVVDAKWRDIFSKAGHEKTFRILLRLDPAKHEVRALDREYEVAWSAGVPTLSASMSGFRGQKQEMSFGTEYAYTEQGPTQVYKYRFNTKELKQPLQDAVTSSGWTYRGVQTL